MTYLLKTYPKKWIQNYKQKTKHTKYLNIVSKGSKDY